jgi:hypothetical protein
MNLMKIWKYVFMAIFLMATNDERINILQILVQNIKNP